MPRRMILTDAERQNFLALPTDEDTLIRVTGASMTKTIAFSKRGGVTTPALVSHFSSVHSVIPAD